MRGMTGDDGVVAVLVALIVTALLGLGALVVDVGSWYAEGRQLQNGAQAAAVAVVQTCVRESACDASTSGAGTATTYARLNATDNRAHVLTVCGTGPGLAACPSVARPDEKLGLESLYGCKPLPAALTGPASAPYVEVHTATHTAGGDSQMPPLLIRAALPDDTGTVVRACARASYGAPASIDSKLPLTVSACEYQVFTGAVLPGPPDPALLAPPGPYSATGPWPAGFEKVLYFHDTTGSSPCTTSASGMDEVSGGFGWLESTSCNATSDTTGLYLLDPGSSAPGDCAAAALKSMVGQVIAIPIFVGDNGLTGANAGYYMGEFASFVLTGFSLGGQYKHNPPCSGSQRCISGFFTKPSGTTGIIAGPPTGSVAVIQITG